MNYIVTTTINKPTKALELYSRMDATLIVVGDLKTDPEPYKKLRCIYLSPEEQEKQYPKLSEILGWNTIQRRNIGFLYAHKRCGGVGWIATVDDDNIPYSNWSAIQPNTSIEIDTYSNSSYEVCDPVSIVSKELWHRGFPIQKVPIKNDIAYEGKEWISPHVVANLWDGDPDVDAICRITKAPNVKFELKEPFTCGWAPFNSQNTLISASVIPHYMVLPFVGRMDDIWGAYLLYWILRDEKGINLDVVFGPSTVYQARNPQNLIKNLKDEVIGYEFTEEILNRGPKFLQEKFLKTWEAYQIYRDSFK